MISTNEHGGLHARNIWKAFGKTAALRGASISVGSGSVHALIGENGAGKSTLIKTMTGAHRPDRGEVLLGGETVHFDGPRAAADAGISVVHQERQLFPDLSVAENLFANAAPQRYGLIDHRRMHREARTWLDRVGLTVDTRTKVASLNVAQGQLLEIARGLALEASVLLLDEPTASITEREAAVLFDILRDLRSQGNSIVFVSHRLEEVFEICDTITVLRDGQTIIDGQPAASLTHREVIAAMVGRTVTMEAHDTVPQAGGDEGPPLLELNSINTAFGHREINLTVTGGRIVGLYGLVGAGRTELARAVIGMDRVTSGQMLLRGEAIQIQDPHDALHSHRIGYVSEDRKGEGLILEHPIAKNAGITVWDTIKGRAGYLTAASERRVVAPVLDELQVKYSSFDQPVWQLSGGNQQKVSVAKWLTAEVDILIMDEPTVGVDVAAKVEMYRLVEELAANGVGVLVISSDLLEIIRLADEILVMGDKRIVATMANTGDYESLSHTIMESLIRATETGQTVKQT